MYLLHFLFCVNLKCPPLFSLLYYYMLCHIELFFLHCIGSIGTASFYGVAAASRPHPPAQLGEFHVIVHLIRVLLVFVISSIHNKNNTV